MRISDQILLSCPVDLVWAETIDITSWPKWTPTVKLVQRLDNRAFGPGSQALIKQPAQPKTLWRVTAFEDGRAFTWETSGRLFKMRATHRVTPHANFTNCKLTVELIGPIAKLLGPLLKHAVKMALRRENQGLKQWCESENARTPQTTNRTSL